MINKQSIALIEKPEIEFEVQMDIVNMLSTTYIHNRISAFQNIIPPYNEMKYMQLKKNHMKRIEAISLEGADESQV